MTYRLVKMQYGLIQQNPTTEALVVPTTAQLYLSDNATLASIYNANGTALTNSPSVPHGVTIGTGGIDTLGNLVWWADPTHDYSVLFNGQYLPVPTTWVHHEDFTDHVDGTDADPHGDRANAATLYAPLSEVGNPGGLATLDANGLITTTQMVCR